MDGNVPLFSTQHINCAIGGSKCTGSANRLQNTALLCTNNRCYAQTNNRFL